MTDLQPDPSLKKRKARECTEYHPGRMDDDDIKNFQLNYINEYSSLYAEKNALKYHLEEANAIVDQQRQQIERLLMKNEMCNAATQTEEGNIYRHHHHHHQHRHQQQQQQHQHKRKATAMTLMDCVSTYLSKFSLQISIIF